MKKTYFFLFAFCFSRALGQIPYEELNIKEYYDFADTKNLGLKGKGFPNYIDDNSAAPASDDMANAIAERLNDVMDSYLRMYQATGDKAYLIKFVNWAIKVQSIRMDKLGFVNKPVWVPLTDIYRDGSILAPMAEFAFRVKWNNDLSITPLPLQLINIPANLTGGISSVDLSDYGHFANWLLERIFESIDAYLNIPGFFTNAKGFSDNSETGAHPLEINKQASFGSTLLYTGLAYPDQLSHPKLVGYRGKANALTSKYKSFINITDHCSSCLNPPTYQQNVLAYNSVLDCYTWFHAGWNTHMRSCFHACFLFSTTQPNVDDYTEFFEDISHAAVTLKFPIAMNEIYRGQFYDEDLVRFRNTFTKNIWDQGLNGFHDNVYGNEQKLDPHIADDCANSFDCHAQEAMSYMPLSIFDGYVIAGDPTTATPPNVYNIIMDYYTSHFHGSSGGYSGLGFLGISEIVKAQWAKECVNLKLYNRDLVYNQDFNVRNNLSLAPKDITDLFYTVDHPIADPCNLNPADPNYFISNEFIIEPNVVSNMTAGEVITLKDGFTAKEGCTFKASIDENICTDGRMASALRPTPYQETDPWLLAQMDSINQSNLASRAMTSSAEPVAAETQSIQPVQYSFDVDIFPNPGNGAYDLTIKGARLTVKLTVYNFMGTIILQQQFTGTTQHIDISNNTKGIYYVKVESDNQIKTKKIIFE